MSQTNEDAVRTYYTAIDAEEYDTVFALFDESIIYERPGQESIRSIDALKDFYLNHRPLSDGSHKIHSLTSDGETVAVRGTFSGTQADTDVSFGFADFFVFGEDGLIKRRCTYTDRDTV
ncbi:nuclear transport factor 2 family protein [Haloarcula sp. CBA1130]|uniref:nuclear transport factor 2 family protein n=1 Tax=unclassified Haloarcula TaxID=2624677 RepID=UPI0012475EF3|nr:MULTISPECIES: nuclear transport factor 2 family protein [unclassified Haloarcula]KAA9396194.1 nuclear transport factor 2 family protein [Haloarcula sp. CBA1129]KAA9400277.1 nuclear transport factor 2 family protein [Haloarcula sp. CBA1130]